jgi:hypothetical protein
MPKATLTGERLLTYLAARARRKPFHLHVWQWKGHGPVGTHAPGSFHSQTFPDGIGKAFDAYSAQFSKGADGKLAKRAGLKPGSQIVATVRMGLYARACRRAHEPHITELIHNSPIPGLSASVKNGASVSASFWGAETWAEHRNHVHVAVA